MKDNPNYIKYAKQQSRVKEKQIKMTTRVQRAEKLARMIESEPTDMTITGAILCAFAGHHKQTMK